MSEEKEGNEFDIEPYGTNPTKRLTIPAAEEILYKPFACLDHGFVRLIDYMGSDERVVQAARVSYGKGTKTVSEDISLIRYLIREDHATPIQKPRIELHVKTPLFVAREWYRHRTGTYATFNELSLRYSEPEEYYVPELEDVGLQDSKNKQGRIKENVPEDLKEFTRQQIIEISEKAKRKYKSLTDKGIAREVARAVLTVNFYTTFYWTMDLYNMFHFLKLRMDERALDEIRKYANSVAENIIKPTFPICYGAFEDYVLNAERLSTLEQKALKIILSGGDIDSAIDSAGIKGRDKREFKEKIDRINSASLETIVKDETR